MTPSLADLKFTAQQRAIICLLLLRGPQTPGELRTRSNRLADFADVSEVESALNQLQNLNNQTLVKKLEREPGKRESRYVQLFSDLEYSNVVEAETINAQLQVSSSEDGKQLAQRVTALEQQVTALTEQIACLAELLEDK